MSADFNTEILMKGTKKELLAMLSVIIENEYLDGGEFRSSNDCVDIYDVTDEDELMDFVSNADGEVRVEGTGPYGGPIEDCEMFEKMAKAAPKADFCGNVSGWGTGEDVNFDATLKNGVLHIKNFLRSFEDKLALLEELFPLEELCKIFKIRPDDVDYDNYRDYLKNWEDVGYEDLNNYFNNVDVTKDEFRNAIKAFRDVDKYSSRFTAEWDYDPVKKKKINADTDKNADKKPAVKVSANTAETFARKISPAPASIEFEGKIFVHTNCKNEKALAEFITGKGGEVKGSTVAKTDYIIIGDKTAKESSKITKAIELNTDKGKNIIALTESEFIKLTGYGAKD